MSEPGKLVLVLQKVEDRPAADVELRPQSSERQAGREDPRQRELCGRQCRSNSQHTDEPRLPLGTSVDVPRGCSSSCPPQTNIAKMVEGRGVA